LEQLEPSSSGNDNDSSDGGLSEASRAVRARASRADGQTWTSRAYWHTRGQVLGLDLRQVLGWDSARNTYALERSVQEAIRLPPAYRQEIVQSGRAYLSLGVAFTARGDSGSDTLGGTSQKKTERLTSEAYMRQADFVHDMVLLYTAKYLSKIN
jgi:hypothetical protein